MPDASEKPVTGTARPSPNPGLASTYLVSTVAAVDPDDSVGVARARLASHRFDDASYVFLVSRDGLLTGVLPIATVFAASADQCVGDIGTLPCAAVPCDSDVEHAASAAIRSGLATVALLDRGGRFAGAIPPDKLMTILREEHAEDLHHMVGIWTASMAARSALTAAPYRRALYRLPWLLLGLVGSALATALMTQHESVLRTHVALAFFIPAVVYIADAVGTQAEAVAVRGLSLAQAVSPSVILGECGTGVLIGATFALLAFPAIWLSYGSAALAMTVSLTLVAASSVATSIGVGLPWAFARLGYDPAYGSGPVATVIQDVLSLAIYLTIATILL
jgi:magnesium transporter